MSGVTLKNSLNDVVDKWLVQSGGNKLGEDDPQINLAARPSRLGVGASAPASKLSHHETNTIEGRITRDLKRRNEEIHKKEENIKVVESDNEDESRTKVAPTKKGKKDNSWTPKIIAKPTSVSKKKRKNKKKIVVSAE